MGSRSPVTALALLWFFSLAHDIAGGPPTNNADCLRSIHDEYVNLFGSDYVDFFDQTYPDWNAIPETLQNGSIWPCGPLDILPYGVICK
jgi:hypothetical protein